MIDVKTLLLGKVSENTINTYSLSWDLYTNFCGSEENALQPISLVEWREYLINVQENSASTINLRLSGIKRIIKEAASQGIISRRLHSGFKRVESLPPNAMPDRKRANNRVLISTKQMRDIIDATKADLRNPQLSRDRALLLTLATSGMRSSELCSVKVKDILDLGVGCVIDNIVVKGGRTRRVPISRECYEAIRDWLFMRPLQSEWVFITERWHNPFVPEEDTYLLWSDTPMTRGNVLYIVKKYSQMIGVDHVKTHDFRRFVGTTLARDSIRVAQQVLGHKNIATTSMYMLDEVELGVTENILG